MKTYKWTLMAAIMLMAALALTGCMNTGNQATEPMVSVMPSAGMNGTGNVGDSNNTNGSGLNGGNAGMGAATPFDWTTNAMQVETAVKQISEIGDCRVVVTGTTALVGVKYTNAYQGETTERIREMVAGAVRESDPTIQTVAVTSAEADVEAIFAISDKIRGGASADSMAEEINKIVRNPTTMR